MQTGRYILIYDDHCAMCAWYSDLFVRLGFLTHASRMGYAEVPAELLKKLDIERAGNEIPLYDTKEDKVVYGIDALVTVLDIRMKWIKPIAQLPLVNTGLRKLYKLISFNRKGIVAHIAQPTERECVPTYNYNYKKFFIVLCYFFSFLLLNTVHAYTLNNYADWLYIISGLMCVAAVVSTHKFYLELASQWMLQLLVVLLVLIPFSLLAPHVSLAALLYFGICCVLFIVQYRKRIKYLMHYYAKGG